MCNLPSEAERLAGLRHVSLLTPGVSG
jgi:hypothetical protein